MGLEELRAMARAFRRADVALRKADKAAAEARTRRDEARAALAELIADTRGECDVQTIAHETGYTRERIRQISIAVQERRAKVAATAKQVRREPGIRRNAR